METGQRVSAFEARTRLGELMDYVRYSRQPCFIERHGKIVAVLTDIRSYEEAVLPRRYQEWVQEGLEQIKASYKPEKIILFGSVAFGQIQEGSDIDFLILKKTSARRYERIEEVLRLLPLDNPIEPHVYTPEELQERLGEGDPFLTEVVRKGIVLYEAQK